MSHRKKPAGIAYICAILILVLVMLYSGLRILESTVSVYEIGHPPVQTKTITRNGIDYFPRQDITVILVIGVDEQGPVVSSNSYNNPGAADLVALMVFNEQQENCTILCLNRDTMVEMPILGLGGKHAGTYFGQLALSHTYGSGLEDSCENTLQTVSNYLGGVPIDHYVSLNMDAISILNDAVGGVTVTVTEDFSQVDPSLTKGEVTLTGQQAITFVRSRKDVGTQMNVSRMERQEVYMHGLVKAIRSKLEAEDTFALTVVEQLSDYMVTDCSAKVISGILSRYGHYSIQEILSPEGKNVQGEAYYEFYPDREKLDELVLRLFYAPKN